MKELFKCPCCNSGDSCELHRIAPQLQKDRDALAERLARVEKALSSMRRMPHSVMCDTHDHRTCDCFIKYADAYFGEVKP